MGMLVKLETEYGSILMESSITETTGTLQPAGEISDIKKKLGDMLDVITPISESIISSVEKLSKMPDSITAEYGLSITPEGNLFVVKAAGEASLRVTFEWSSDKKYERGELSAVSVKFPWEEEVVDKRKKWNIKPRVNVEVFAFGANFSGRFD